MNTTQRFIACFLLALSLVVLNAAAEARAEDDRALPLSQQRHLLVKALGQGRDAKEAEADVLRAARAFAAERLKALGGAQALLPGEEGVRVVNLHHFPQMGFSAARAVALVEFRLRPQPDSLPASAGLVEIQTARNAAQLEISANIPAEAAVILDKRAGGDVEVLPGGTQVLRLTPGKTTVLKFAGDMPLTVLACTGGLSIPAGPATVEEALLKSRNGPAHPSVVQGVVSDCVEQRLLLLKQRSMRQKGSESPVNMTGAAGHTAGTPAPDELK